MRVNTLTVPTMGLMALLALPMPTRAIETAEEAVAVTDPVLLESMGFAPDEANVYATPQALREMVMGADERAAREGAFAFEESAPSRSPFGASPGYSTVSHPAFRPTLSVSSSPSYYEYDGVGGFFCTGGSPWYDAQFESLPHGAVLDGVRLWLYDASAPHGFIAWLFRSCQPDSQSGDVVTTTLGEAVTDTTQGNTSIVLGGSDTDIVDSTSCTYWLRVRFDYGFQQDCSAGTDELRIQKARARWRRQISPAPATATFDDVPTSHLFFRHIEALASSGITGGCSADSFCPNSPLTRGQMAAFLATALGLHWGQIDQIEP